MDEFDLISRYFKRDKQYPHIPVNIGDDCAVLEVPSGSELVFSIDTLLPDVHFFSSDAPHLIAQRAVRVAISDLAAMGAEPLCCTLALSLADVDEEWLAGFSEGFHRSADLFGCPLVGGDTVRGPLAISIQVQGHAPKSQSIRRSGAREGDVICVSGVFGDGAAALQILKGELSLTDAAEKYFCGRFYRPEPQLELGIALRGLANSAIDVSDGLVADLAHICKASHVGAELDLDAIPLAHFMRDEVESSQGLFWALNGGDDYQLCFTVAENRVAELERFERELGLRVSVIGKIVAGDGIRSMHNHDVISPVGYRHFS